MSEVSLTEQPGVAGALEARHALGLGEPGSHAAVGHRNAFVPPCANGHEVFNCPSDCSEAEAQQTRSEVESAAMQTVRVLS